MYRAVFVVFLSLLVLLQTLNQTGILLAFKFRQEYIAKNLCVQRDKKVNTCNGKCHLKKELKKAAEQDKETKKPNPEKTKSDTSDTPFLHYLCHFAFHTFSLKISGTNELTLTIISTYISDIFIPPNKF